VLEEEYFGEEYWLPSKPPVRQNPRDDNPMCKVRYFFREIHRP
jgi:hypothetical protein